MDKRTIKYLKIVGLLSQVINNMGYMQMKTLAELENPPMMGSGLLPMFDFIKKDITELRREIRRLK